MIYSLKAMEVRRKLRAINENVATLEQTALELLRHPDATPEQILKVHVTLVALHQSMVAVRRIANEKYKVAL